MFVGSNVLFILYTLAWGVGRIKRQTTKPQLGQEGEVSHVMLFLDMVLNIILFVAVTCFIRSNSNKCAGQMHNCVKDMKIMGKYGLWAIAGAGEEDEEDKCWVKCIKHNFGLKEEEKEEEEEEEKKETNCNVVENIEKYFEIECC